jgi:opacity protein-like surface antigen
MVKGKHFKQLLLLGSMFTSTIAAADDKNFFIQFNSGFASTKAMGIENSEIHGTVSTYGGRGSDYNNRGIIGLELGYKLNNKFRTSVSFDHLGSSNFKIYDYDQHYEPVDEAVPEDERIPEGFEHESMNTSYKVKSSVLMLNGYYDLLENARFTPYLLFGIGISSNVSKASAQGSILFYNSEQQSFADRSVAVSNSYSSKTINNLAYKIGLGIRYNLSSNFDINARYQYVDLGKFKTGADNNSLINQTPQKGKIHSHQFVIGVSYKF